MNSTERNRISWDEYGMLLAHAASQRSPDPYIIVGAAGFRADHSTACTGYNGAPAGVEINWSDRELRRPLVVHAEYNCLKYAKHGEIYYLYVTMLPCASCLKFAAATGVKEIIYDKLYHRDDSSLIKAQECGILLRQYSLTSIGVVAK